MSKFSVGRFAPSAAAVDQVFQYGLEDVPADHPEIPAYESVRMSSVTAATVPDVTFVDGSHYVDGRKVSSPTANLDVNHLYQMKTDAVASWLIVGIQSLCVLAGGARRLPGGNSGRGV